MSRTTSNCNAICHDSNVVDGLAQC